MDAITEIKTKMITNNCLFIFSQLFRKLSISNFQPKTGNGINECNTKYETQKNQSITISPVYGKKTILRRSTINKKELRRSTKFTEHEQEDDISINSTTKHQKRYFKNCIKKRFNNNYEEQINSANDENIVFTDNKVYISLNGCNSSISSSLGNGTNSLKKNRRVIYPTSGNYKLSGFLRDCDFNYDYKNEVMANNLEVEEKLKFNLMKDNSESQCNSSVKNVVFEKVKYVSSKKCQPFEESYSNNSFMVMHLKSKNNIMHDKTNSIHTKFIDGCTFNHEESCCAAEKEDDLQWKTFMEHRKHSTNTKNYTLEINKSLIHSFNDSGFGSQLCFSSSNNVEKSLRNLESCLDDEIYDNSFNEELERRVQVEFSELYKSLSSNSEYDKSDSFT